MAAERKQQIPFMGLHTYRQGHDSKNIFSVPPMRGLTMEIPPKLVGVLFVRGN